MRAPVVCLFIVLASPGILFCDIIHVPGDHDQIQEAINAAENGDTVVVRPGTYFENLDFLGKIITVESEEGAGFTFIDGGSLGTVVTFQNGEDPDTLMQGFTIMNGYSQYDGGGILCQFDSSPTLYHNIIADNVSARGGGIFCYAGSTPLIKHNTVTGNHANHNGAGICCELGASATIKGNTITKNRGNVGSGIYCEGCAYVEISGNTIMENIADQNGGGIYCDTAVSVIISDNEIIDNSAVYKGGGVYYVDSSVEIENNTMLMNEASQGGAVFGTASTSMITGNTMNANTAVIGSALSCRDGGKTTLVDNTILQNLGFAESTDCSVLCHTLTEVFVENNAIKESFETGLICKFSPIVLSNNQIYFNRGAGFYYEGEEQVTVRGNIFYGNLGMAIRCTGCPLVAIEENLVSNNSARGGTAGIQCNSCDVVITGNLVTENGNNNGSGGIGCTQSTGLIENNDITWNWGTKAGGVLLDLCDGLLLKGNNISKNATFNEGGGVLCTGLSAPVIVNNILRANLGARGGGLAAIAAAHPVVCNVTFFKNEATESGGGIYVMESDIGFPTQVSNTILYKDHSLQGLEIELGQNGGLAIGYSDVDGGQASVNVGPGASLDWGSGMIDSAPLFVEALAEDFHLTYSSPCLNSGDNAAPGLPAEDFDGNPRMAHGTVDMGADEFHTHLYYTGDLTPGGEIEAKFVGVPSATPVGLFLGAAVLDPPISTIWGLFYIQVPYILLAPLGAVPSSGVLVFRATLPSTPAAPYDVPTQAMIGNALTQLSMLEVR